MTELYYRTARELRELMVSGQVSAAEVLQAHLDRIDQVNPGINAIITRSDEVAREAARRADEAVRRGENLGPLHGLPMAHKDLADTAGIRTTYGSTLFANHVPDTDELIVARMKAAGAVTVGKTNVPEFGAGIHSTNEVFGPTRNPYNRALAAGGSSGGAAAALAAGMVPLADGSDDGGSLRNPATYCNIVGFRPSIGRVAVWPSSDPFWPLAVEGPMARNVSDLALLLSVLAEPSDRAPWSATGAGFPDPVLEQDFSGITVAYSPTLQGQLRVDPRVVAAMQPARAALADITGGVVETAPDMSGVDQAYLTLRSFNRVFGFGELQQAHPEAFGPRMTETIEYGRTRTVDDLIRAHRDRAAAFERIRSFLDENNFLVTTVTQVLPHPVEQLWAPEIDGEPTTSYLDSMQSTYWFTLAGVPALSLPAGFTESGLPVGVQIIGRPGDDLGVLRLAAAIERVLPTGDRRPEL